MCVTLFLLLLRLLLILLQLLLNCLRWICSCSCNGKLQIVVTPTMGLILFCYTFIERYSIMEHLFIFLFLFFFWKEKVCSEEPLGGDHTLCRILEHGMDTRTNKCSHAHRIKYAHYENIHMYNWRKWVKSEKVVTLESVVSLSCYLDSKEDEGSQSVVNILPFQQQFHSPPPISVQ